VYICTIMEFNNNLKDWVYSKHEETNHMYDEYLPYKFHLMLTEKVGKDFAHLLDHSKDIETGHDYIGVPSQQTLRKACLLACVAHDLIEDTRTSYNDVKTVLGQHVADIVYAVTNEKGKTRKERANDKYYEGIRNTPGAVFVKLSDRIANVMYSKMTGSRMFEIYRKENKDFQASLGRYASAEHYEPMFAHLDNLFSN